MSEALLWTARLLAFSVLLQTVEFLQIRERALGIWDWKILRADFAEAFGGTSVFFDLIFANSRFAFLLIAQLFCVLVWLAFPFSGFVLPVFVTSFLISLRWRGVFNGGADSMTMLLLLALSLGVLFPDLQRVCLWFIAIQLILSYFLSGVVKLKSTAWRNGIALSEILLFSNSDVPSEFRLLAQNRRLARFGAWCVILFECLFPLALLNHGVCEVFLVLAFGFHLVNVRVFGLNRFLWAWLAAYPALLFCASSLN